VQISTTGRTKSGVFDGYIKLTVVTTAREALHRGHGVFRRQAALHPDQGHQYRRRGGAHMLYTTNRDVPGIIGTLGQTMGENGVNIANFTLGRSGRARMRSRCSIWMASRPNRCWNKLRATGLFQQVRPLVFDVA
jgi:D-3-phosphoglycerate dehydrogenase / 2-oxoglutarate reductase